MVDKVLFQKKLKNVIELLARYIEKRKNLMQKYDWKLNARPSQCIPQNNDWKVWLIMAGRGFGKTRTGAETIRQLVDHGQAYHIGLIGQSIQEAKAIMVFGESGIMNVFPPHERPRYCDSQKKLYFKTGAVATLFGGNNTERLRGPQFDFVWIDEFAKFRKPQELYDQVMMCLRLGEKPKCLITTTPRPIPFLAHLIQQPSVHLTKGTTFENKANLANNYIEQMEKIYSQTHLGLQELHAELLLDQIGSLWKRETIHYKSPEDDNWRRIVIAIDPATTHHAQSDETGIVVVGLHDDGLVYVLEDLSGRLSPTEWGTMVTKAYWQYNADRVVAEVNKGGDLVERVVKSIDQHVSYKAVRATRGKIIRAEPVAALYEQNKVFHTRQMRLLEQQMCDYIPEQTSKSPDRMDALVWAITDLMLAKEASMMPKVWQ